ncbi:Gfo/Idh/MocA family protein [Aeromicrobium sp. CTD01-1L150]|uniref:Gfo/Idh/MocA family protein n=1 Tax=Aeromicrobium sp. CTD01-1L150 TaxID=3341830 RepID=UPI0035BF9E68
MSHETIDVAVVGLGFGQDFIPIYREHPRVGRVGLVDTAPERLRAVGERFGITDRFDSLEVLLATDEWDAVHLLSPVSHHAPQTLAVLESGRHCACAVPMATELDDLQAIIEARQRHGTRYMMMETAVYADEFHLVEQLYRDGELGQLTSYRGFHVQNLDGYPPYWRGFPPMKYATHALTPLLALTDSAVAHVATLGSGRLTADRVGAYDNPFPTQVGLFRLADSPVVADVTLSFFQTARPYVEGFDVFGDRGGIEWPRHEGDGMAYHQLQPLEDDLPEVGLRGRRATTRTVRPPSHEGTLPEPLRRFRSEFTVESGQGETLTVKAEHGGSHPHLVHEFVSSIVEDREPWIGAVRAATWTAPGICAHESSLRDGERLQVPAYQSSTDHTAR